MRYGIAVTREVEWETVVAVLKYSFTIQLCHHIIYSVGVGNIILAVGGLYDEVTLATNLYRALLCRAVGVGIGLMYCVGGQLAVAGHASNSVNLHVVYLHNVWRDVIFGRNNAL